MKVVCRMDAKERLEKKNLRNSQRERGGKVVCVCAYSAGIELWTHEKKKEEILPQD